VIFISTNELAISILIGGQSKRFGMDKGIYKIKNKPMILYQLEKVSKLNYKIFLIAKSQDQMIEYIENIDINPLTGFVIDEKEFLE